MNGTLVGSDSSAPYDYTINNISAGSYNLKAKATDNDGATKMSSIVAITVTGGGNPGTGTPVEKHGKLQVRNGTLTDKNNNPVQLKGMSSFWINWNEGGKFANSQVIDWLADDWGINLPAFSLGSCTK